MLFTHTTFIGIDPTAGVRPFTYTALNNELELLALGQGNMDEVLAFVAGQREAIVAVTSPSSIVYSLTAMVFGSIACLAGAFMPIWRLAKMEPLLALKAE